MSHDLRSLQLPSIVAFALVLVVSSIALGQSVKSSYLPGLDFSKYHTYEWVTTRPHPKQNVDAEIKGLIDSTGCQRLEQDGQPSRSNCRLPSAIRQEEQWSSWRYNELDNPTPTRVTAYAGTLGVDIYDAVRKQIVWTGLATKAINPNDTQKTKQKNLDKVIRRLLQGFLPKQPRP